MILQSKYEKLARYLEQIDADKINMTFDEIEAILGELLPGAAGKRAWWANSATNNHALNGWLDVGWETANVNMKERILDFVKMSQLSSAPMQSRDNVRTYPRRSRSPRSNTGNTELNMIVQRAGGVDILQKYMVIVERYLFGEITEMELGQELRRLFHQRR